MPPLRAPRVTYANVVATICLVLLLGGGAIATAQITGKDGTISACYRSKGKQKGAVRIVKASAKCRKREKRTSWNQRGVAPAGAVLFFDLAACPAGWSAYAPAAGRYLVGLNPGGKAGAAVGTALGDQENRATGKHAHTVTDPGHVHPVEVDPIYSGGNVAAVRVAGTANDGGAPMHPQIVQSKALSATTGVSVDPAGSVDGTNAPYVQLLACRKN